MIILVKIHNNQIQRIEEVSSFEDGIKLIIKRSEKQLNRQLSDEEIEILDNEYSLYDDSDSDNIFTWSLAIVEEL